MTEPFDYFEAWLNSTEGNRFIAIALTAGVAIIISGIIAALIGRSATKRLLTIHEHDRKASAIAALSHAARLASIYHTLSPVEQQSADRAAGDADIHVRLLPVRGAGNAATWAAHQIEELKIRSATFGYKGDAALSEFTDRLVQWQHRPGKARKLFRSDLDRWNFENLTVNQTDVLKQQTWEHNQIHPMHPPPPPT